MVRNLWERKLARSIHAGSILEIFMVTAVTAVLAIRFFLEITGYPQVGGGGLHIAHVLVGGFFMLISILILLIFLGNYSKNLAAFLGGFGFGAFIDELGKFITSNNDYFFQPTIGLIYIIFVLLFIFIRKINTSNYFTEKEKQVNLLEMSKEAVIRGDDTNGILLLKNTMERIENPKIFLKDSDKSAAKLDEIPYLLPSSSAEPRIYTALKIKADNFYNWMTQKRWFLQLLIAFFFLKSLISLIEAIYISVDIHNAAFWAVFALVSLGIYIILVSEIPTGRKISSIVFLIILTSIFPFTILDLTLPSLSLIEGVNLFFTLLAAGFSIAGILKMRKDRLKAYRLLESSVLIYIFFVHVFDFFEIQLYGIFSLFIDLITLVGLKYMIEQEVKKKNEKEILNNKLLLKKLQLDNIASQNKTDDNQAEYQMKT